MSATKDFYHNYFLEQQEAEQKLLSKVVFLEQNQAQIDYRISLLKQAKAEQKEAIANGTQIPFAEALRLGIISTDTESEQDEREHDEEYESLIYRK